MSGHRQSVLSIISHSTKVSQCFNVHRKQWISQVHSSPSKCKFTLKLNTTICSIYNIINNACNGSLLIHVLAGKVFLERKNTSLKNNTARMFYLGILEYACALRYCVLQRWKHSKHVDGNLKDEFVVLVRNSKIKAKRQRNIRTNIPNFRFAPVALPNNCGIGTDDDSVMNVKRNISSILKR